MKSILAILSAICLFATSTLAFAPVAPSSRVGALSPRSFIAPYTATATSSAISTTSLSVFGNRKTEAQKAEEEAKASKYWAGEWVCKDCGYIYNRAECAGMYFEEQGPGFRCPQCSGPRRRYAKKVGDRVGTTLDGGDAPILIFSFGGLIATIVFGVWAVQNL
jgi:rubredoxin